MEDANDDKLVLSSSGVVLEVNERGKRFYKTMRGIVDRMYRHSFHLWYKAQSNESKNYVIFKLRQPFWEHMSMRDARLHTCNNKIIQ